MLYNPRSLHTREEKKIRTHTNTHRLLAKNQKKKTKKIKRRKETEAQPLSSSSIVHHTSFNLHHNNHHHSITIHLHQHSPIFFTIFSSSPPFSTKQNYPLYHPFTINTIPNTHHHFFKPPPFFNINPKPTIPITIIKPPSHSHNIIINQIKATITTLSKQQQHIMHKTPPSP
jgi:hypothetical protein